MIKPYYDYFISDTGILYDKNNKPVDSWIDTVNGYKYVSLKLHIFHLSF